MQKIWQDVMREEFKEFVKSYPRKLEYDAFGAYEPSIITYNDFILADKWPESVVAQTCAYDDNPESYYYVPEEARKYMIVVNCEEIAAERLQTLYIDNAGRPAPQL